MTRPSDRVTPLLHEDYDDQTRSSNGEIGGRGAGVQTEDPREHDISFGSDGNKSLVVKTIIRIDRMMLD